MIKKYFRKLYTYGTLNESEAYDLLLQVSSGKANPAEMASLLTVFLLRPITLDELTAFRNVLLELCIPVNLERDCIDLCGTGGDEKNTFNISTLASFVTASCGVQVAKHGNYGVSSVSGSSNVLEFLGYKFLNNSDALKKQLDKYSICFMHAPLFHPALKSVGGVRKELGIKTFFNILGPLVNPAKPSHQLIGVYSKELARMYHYLLQKENKNYYILHSLDGYDEISCTADYLAYSKQQESIVNPVNLNLPILQEQDLFGGNSIEDAAHIFLNVLQNKCSDAHKQVVALNAAYAISCFKQITIQQAYQESLEAIISGKAYQCFSNLINHN